MPQKKNTSQRSAEVVPIEWQEIIKKYAASQRWRSYWQLSSTMLLYIALWSLMFFSLEKSYWLTFCLSIVAAGVLVRLFIIFHDCGHRSFFQSKQANNFWGFILGVLAFTPNHAWWKDHRIHHGAVGNLDKRGIGDIWTMTGEEYAHASSPTKFKYRLVRNPLSLFLIGAPFYFAVFQRFSRTDQGAQERQSVRLTNVGLLVMMISLSWIMGFKAYLMLQLPIIYFASIFGVWLFYVQHQYEGVHWWRGTDWDFLTAAMQGCSYYKLPRILQWFSGNIGFHHIHHLNPRIPNYALECCYLDNPFLQKIRTISLWSSLKSLKLNLWDEQRQKFVSFKQFQRCATEA
jgi:omega-6 fatty acid desaturase (delta-12 desaturase)